MEALDEAGSSWTCIAGPRRSGSALRLCRSPVPTSRSVSPENADHPFLARPASPGPRPQRRTPDHHASFYRPHASAPGSARGSLWPSHLGEGVGRDRTAVVACGTSWPSWKAWPWVGRDFLVLQRCQPFEGRHAPGVLDPQLAFLTAFLRAESGRLTGPTEATPGSLRSILRSNHQPLTAPRVLYIQPIQAPQTPHLPPEATNLPSPCIPNVKSPVNPRTTSAAKVPLRPPLHPPPRPRPLPPPSQPHPPNRTSPSGCGWPSTPSSPSPNTTGWVWSTGSVSGTSTWSVRVVARTSASTCGRASTERGTKGSSPANTSFTPSAEAAPWSAEPPVRWSSASFRTTRGRRLRIPAMPTTDSGKPIADSRPCRSPWRSGGP